MHFFSLGSSIDTKCQDRIVKGKSASAPSWDTQQLLRLFIFDGNNSQNLIFLTFGNVLQNTKLSILANFLFFLFSSLFAILVIFRQKIANNESNLTIADMEILWLDLSRLTKSLGYNFCFTLRYKKKLKKLSDLIRRLSPQYLFSYFLLFLFMEVIVTTYEALIISLSMTIDPVLTPMTILVLLYMASIPFTAELATKKVCFSRLIEFRRNASRYMFTSLFIY